MRELRSGDEPPAGSSWSRLLGRFRSWGIPAESRRWRRRSGDRTGWQLTRCLRTARRARDHPARLSTGMLIEDVALDEGLHQLTRGIGDQVAL